VLNKNKIPFGSILCIAFLVFITPAIFAAPPVKVYRAEAFVLDLWEDAGPATMAPVTTGTPLALKAARGETESALVVLKALKNCPALEIRASDFKRAGRTVIAKSDIRVRIIFGVQRITPYAALAGTRYPKRYTRATGLRLPDILVRDESALQASIRNWRGKLHDEADLGPAKTTPFRVGRFKYLLVTISVPKSAKPGVCAGALTVADGTSSLTVPLRLTVRPFTLNPNHGRILGISNEFCDPNNPLLEESLRLTREAGMTFTRTSNILSSRSKSRVFTLFRKYGFLTISQGRPPRSSSDVKSIPKDFAWYFYGRDEPQPKDRNRSDWGNMAEHIRRSINIHKMGGKVMTSLPYTIALELRSRNSRVYSELAKLGLRNVYEPLDWANIGLGIQRLGNPRRRRGETNKELFNYIAQLQQEFRRGPWKESGPSLPSKHKWVETYYWPQGLMRYPYFGRLLFGYYMFNSHMDGAMAWTMYRIRNTNPLSGEGANVATLAYPGVKKIYSTYNIEAIREGVDDLRYAQQAYRAIARLLTSSDKRKRTAGEKLRKRFLDVMSPYENLTPGGKRIDLSGKNPEGLLQETREKLADIIAQATG